MSRKPLITAKERAPFEPSPEQDAFYLPGYSDKRVERELAIRAGERRPQNGRLHLVVTQDLAGKPVKLKEREFRMKGYVPLTQEMATKLGYDVENSGYEVRPDGSVGLNEYTVFYATADAAAKEYRRVETRNEAMQQMARSKVEDATDALNRSLGLEGRGAAQPLFEADTKE